MIYIPLSSTAEALVPFWNDRKFIPVNELFPQWMTAKIMLDRYAEELGFFSVESYDSGDVKVGPVQPMVTSAMTGESIPMWMSFPEEDRYQFFDIYEKCVKDFIPNLDKFDREKINNTLLSAIFSEIQCHHHLIEISDGPSFKDWLRYNLGLYSKWNGINFIDFKTEV